MDDQQDAVRAVRRARAATEPGNEQGCRDIIVIGGSAGALDAILNIAGGFPEEFKGSIFIVPSEGGPPRAIRTQLASARYPIWSADGLTIFSRSTRTTC